MQRRNVPLQEEEWCPYAVAAVPAHSVVLQLPALHIQTDSASIHENPMVASQPNNSIYMVDGMGGGHGGPTPAERYLTASSGGQRQGIDRVIHAQEFPGRQHAQHNNTTSVVALWWHCLSQRVSWDNALPLHSSRSQAR